MVQDEQELRHEVEIIWVRPEAEMRAQPFLRERALHTSKPRRPPSGSHARGSKVAAYTVAAVGAQRRHGNGLLVRRLWFFEPTPYPAGAFCPREGVHPASIAVGRLALPAYPVLLREAVARGEVLAPKDAAWLAAYEADLLLRTRQ